VRRGRDLIAQKKDGSDLAVHLVVGEFAIEERSGFACIVQDISLRKQVEDRLRQREELLRQTIRHAPIGMATVDLEGRILTINEAFSSMVGYAERELVHKPVNSITHPDDVELADRFLRRLREGKIDHYNMQKRYIRKDGSTVEAMLHASAAHDSTGKPLLYIAQTEDLTERLEAEKNLGEMREQLAHVTRLHMIGEMAAGLAHEINQPLTAIATYAQASRRMIEAGMASSDEVLEAMDKISQQAQRAGDVIAALRGFVRKRSSSRASVDMNELIKGALQLAEVDARTHETSIELQLNPGLPQVKADPVQIQQVVLNLLLNGMEAMADPEYQNRKVTVRTAMTPEDSVQVAVEDLGRGISSEEEKDLFRAFVTSKTSGMGMGLAICRSIVDSHGGSLWFTRNSDIGTTFYFSIPAKVGESDEEN
jgi:two-component system sensor kinase FixL